MKMIVAWAGCVLIAKRWTRKNLPADAPLRIGISHRHGRGGDIAQQ